MLKKITLNTILLLCIILSYNACIKDVDFDQAENLSISPALEVSIFHFEEPANTFLDDDGVEIITVKDSVNIGIFSDQFVVDNLIKADFLFETTNTINRAYQAEIEFYNDLFELQHIINFGVSESPNNQDVVVEYVEVFEGMELEALKATTNLVLTLNLLPSTDGSTLNENTPGDLLLRSKASFYFNINTSE